MGPLHGKTILIGVSGGIAAYKTCYLVSRLVKNGATVHVVMTKNATEFVTPLTFETLSQNRVTVDTFDRDFTWEVEHVALAKKADIVMIAPATANVIAKLACGIADDFLTTTVLACRCPILFAPAMNSAMLGNPVTQKNISTLVSRGMTAVYGESGRLACGDSGKGRMAEPDDLYDAVAKKLSVKRDYTGKTVLVTSGATRAALDPVRFLTNRSSGKMGYALACAAQARGAEVIYIKGFTNTEAVPDSITTVDVQTTEELLDAVKAHIARADVMIMAAAPCDYTVVPAEHKIKDKTLNLQLDKAPDCAAWAGEHKKGKKLVAFAAETCDAIKNATDKLKAKNADMIVLNDVTREGAGFDTDTNIATLITKSGTEELPIMQKRALADVILDRILDL